MDNTPVNYTSRSVWDILTKYFSPKNVVGLFKEIKLPPQPVTKAQAAVIIYNFLSLIRTNSTNENIFSPDYWAETLFRKVKRASVLINATRHSTQVQFPPEKNYYSIPKLGDLSDTIIVVGRKIRWVELLMNGKIIQKQYFKPKEGLTISGLSIHDAQPSVGAGIPIVVFAFDQFDFKINPEADIVKCQLRYSHLQAQTRDEILRSEQNTFYLDRITPLTRTI